MAENKIDEGDIVELVDASGLPGLLKKGSRGLVYHVNKDTKMIGVHWLNNYLPSIRYGYFFMHRFRKIAEDRQFKLLLAAADLEGCEEKSYLEDYKLKIAQIYISQFLGDRNEKN